MDQQAEARRTPDPTAARPDRGAEAAVTAERQAGRCLRDRLDAG